MATIKEVSRLANVSAATVSRVLNGNVPVSAETRERVMAAVAELGYSPNAFARSLVTNRSGDIGVVINEISSPYYSGIVKGIEEVVEPEGIHLVVSSGHADEALERRAVEFLKLRRSDALILYLETLSDDDLLHWAGQGTPLVVLGRYLAELAERCVYLDNVAGGYLATKHLIDNGHRRIAHITGWLALRDGRDRLEGYRRALAEADIPYDEALVIEGRFVEESGQRGIKRLLERKLDFTALFAANDQTAAGALQTLREEGVRVPDDVSIIGFDDLLLAGYLSPALTTVRQPLVEMGHAAARLALRALEPKGATPEKGEVKRKFEPTLVIRESVKKLHSVRKGQR